MLAVASATVALSGPGVRGERGGQSWPLLFVRQANRLVLLRPPALAHPSLTKCSGR